MLSRMLSREQALELTERIRITQDTLDDDIIAAFKGCAYTVLDYHNWAEYAEANFPKFKQSPAERLNSVVKMSEAGMSTRSIGAALGVDQSTVVADRRKVTGDGNPSVAGTDTGSDLGERSEPAPSGRRKSTASAPTPRRRTAKAPSPKQSRKLIEAYQSTVAAHPKWTIKEVTKYLISKFPALTAGDKRFGHQDVGRLRMWAEAPPAIRDAYYDGRINAATGETVLGSKMSKYLDDRDKINLVEKVIAGLISSGAPGLRACMELLPSTYGQVRADWLNPDKAMSYDDLLSAKLDGSAEYADAARRSTEEAAHLASRIKIDYGIKTEKWIDGLDADIDLVEAELPAIMALTFQARPMAEKLREASRRLWSLAERIDNGGTRPEPRAATTSFTVIDGDAG